MTPKIARTPRTTKIWMTITFTIENANSHSAKIFAVKMFMPRTSTAKKRHQIQTGTSGIQYCMASPAPVKAVPSVTVHDDQKARRRPNEAVGVKVKRPGLGHGARELSETHHHQRNGDRAEDIGKKRSEGSGLREHPARIEKKPRPDDAAQRNHDEVARLHRPLKLPALMLFRALHVQILIFGHPEILPKSQKEPDLSLSLSGLR